MCWRADKVCCNLLLYLWYAADDLTLTQDSVYITQPSENHLYVWTSLKLIVVTTVQECSVYSVLWVCVCVCGGVGVDIVKNKSSTFLPQISERVWTLTSPEFPSGHVICLHNIIPLQGCPGRRRVNTGSDHDMSAVWASAWGFWHFLSKCPFLNNPTTCSPTMHLTTHSSHTRSNQCYS